MKRPTKEDFIDAWDAVSATVPSDAMDLELRLSTQIVRALANGEPLSLDKLANTWNMDVTEASAILDRGKSKGWQLNEDGELIGATITLKPTRHHFRVKGNDLFAWCSLDTIFLPGLIGEPAEIHSTCFATGVAIHVTISPHGIEEVTPASAVTSIFIPGPSSAESLGLHKAGADSQVCTSINFFISRSVAEEALKEYSNIGILSLEEAYDAMNTILLVPMEKAMGAVN